MSTKIRGGKPVDAVTAHSITVTAASGGEVIVQADFYLSVDGTPIAQSVYDSIESGSPEVSEAAQALVLAVEEAYATNILNANKESTVASLRGLGEDYPGEI